MRLIWSDAVCSNTVKIVFVNSPSRHLASLASITLLSIVSRQADRRYFAVQLYLLAEGENGNIILKILLEVKIVWIILFIFP